MINSFRASDIDLLLIFRKVAQFQSFSLAADDLNTSPSSISMKMAKLESRLNMRLCQRGIRGFRLTPHGSRVLEASNAIYFSMQNFKSEVAKIKSNGGRDIRIGVPHEFSIENYQEIHRILGRLENSDSSVNIHIEVDSIARLSERVADGGLHCAVGYFGPIDQSLAILPLYSESVFCYCSNTHPLYGQPDNQLTYEDLRSQKIACYDDMSDYERDSYPLFCRNDGTAQASSGVLTLILTGNYIGLLPETYATPWLENKLIGRIFSDIVKMKIDISLIYNREISKDLNMELLVKYFSESASRLNSNNT